MKIHLNTAIFHSLEVPRLKNSDPIWETSKFQQSQRIDSKLVFRHPKKKKNAYITSLTFNAEK